MTYLSSHKECPSCGDNHKGRPFCTYPNGYHCFSCGLSKNADRSFTSFQNRRIDIPDQPNLKSELPKFSLANQQWLMKYYVDESTVRKYRVAETDQGALLFPYVVNETVVCYQTRLNGSTRRIQSFGAKEPALFRCSGTGEQHSRTLVIVEDFLSAVRLAEHTDSVCLWGTKAPFLSLKEWVKSYSTICVWLDNDASKENNSGQIAAKKICKTLESILSFNNRKYGFGGVEKTIIKNVATELDPKAYSPSELKQIIGAEIGQIHTK